MTTTTPEVARVSGTIKALKWEDLGADYWRAPAPFFGSFRIEPWGDQGFHVLWSVPGICDRMIADLFTLVDAAKAAAQADYNARIIAAIQPDSVASRYDPNCPDCKGTGERDSGGTHPWGAPALLPCDCDQPDPEPQPVIEDADMKRCSGCGSVRDRRGMDCLEDGSWRCCDCIKPQAAGGLAAMNACLVQLDMLVAESGRGVDWGEEDAFRMGGWFEDTYLANIERAKAFVAGLYLATPSSADALNIGNDHSSDPEPKPAPEIATVSDEACDKIMREIAPVTPSSAGMVSVEAAGWQPIETAPKGVPFLASDGEDMYKAELGSDGLISAWCGQPVVYDVTPTHWMPLPEPPALRALAGDKP